MFLALGDTEGLGSAPTRLTQAPASPSLRHFPGRSAANLESPVLWGSICNPGVSHGPSPERCSSSLTALGAGLVRTGTSGVSQGQRLLLGDPSPTDMGNRYQWDALTVQTQLKELPCPALR